MTNRKQTGILSNLKSGWTVLVAVLLPASAVVAQGVYQANGRSFSHGKTGWWIVVDRVKLGNGTGTLMLNNKIQKAKPGSWHTVRWPVNGSPGTTVLTTITPLLSGSDSPVYSYGYWTNGKAISIKSSKGSDSSTVVVQARVWEEVKEPKPGSRGYRK